MSIKSKKLRNKILRDRLRGAKAKPSFGSHLGMPIAGPMPTAMAPGDGFLDVLNIGRGHLAFKFDKADAMEVERARKVIMDMLTRGYSIFINTPDGRQVKAQGFDPETNEYLIDGPPGQMLIDPPIEPMADAPPPAAPAPKGTEGEMDGAKPPQGSEPARRRGRPAKNEQRVPMRQAHATGIGPTAGG